MSMRWSLGYLALPGVLALISFLVLSSQWLFSRIDPGPLTRQETITFNSLSVVLLICYGRAVFTNPGHIPKDWRPDSLATDAHAVRQRWCRKCDAYKPPRAHHCKICKRCIPKMDHHCPWTINCVSHITYPHFLRFVGYANVAMLYLEYMLYVRAAEVWENRNMPSYYGPSAAQLVHLFALLATNSLTLFALGMLFARATWCLVVNQYTIEGWELERHEVLLRRARVLGGFLDGPNGRRVRIVRQEFPYDIGFWSNIIQGMGTSNIVAWFWPFAASPGYESGLSWETNGFEDPTIGWPPPDPDRMPRQNTQYDPAEERAFNSGYSTSEIISFRERQKEDYARQAQPADTIRRRQVFHKRFSSSESDGVYEVTDQDVNDGEMGEESWQNGEGESLTDFGVDEETEFYDQDMPLSELAKRLKSNPAT